MQVCERTESELPDALFTSAINKMYYANTEKTNLRLTEKCSLCISCLWL